MTKNVLEDTPLEDGEERDEEAEEAMLRRQLEEHEEMARKLEEHQQKLMESHRAITETHRTLTHRLVTITSQRTGGLQIKIGGSSGSSAPGDSQQSPEGEDGNTEGGSRGPTEQEVKA